MDHLFNAKNTWAAHNKRQKEESAIRLEANRKFRYLTNKNKK